MTDHLRALVVTVVHHPEDARIRHRQIAALLEAGWHVTYAAPFSGYPAASATDHPALTIPAPTRSAFAAIVRLGLTPADIGSALPSVTNRFATPRTLQRPSSGEVSGSVPIRTVPTTWENVLT